MVAFESGKAFAQPRQASMISPAPWMRRWVPFSSYTASAANVSFALLQSFSLYAVIEAFAISMTFAMMILLYKPAPVGAEHCNPPAAAYRRLRPRRIGGGWSVIRHP